MEGQFKYFIFTLYVLFRAAFCYIVINELNTDETTGRRYVELKNPSQHDELMGNYELQLSQFKNGVFIVYISQKLPDVSLTPGGYFTVGRLNVDMVLNMKGGNMYPGKAELYYIDAGVTVKVDEVLYVRAVSAYTTYLSTLPSLLLDDNTDNSLTRCDVHGDVMFITAPLTLGTENICDGFYRLVDNTQVVGQHMFEKGTVAYPLQQTRALEPSRITTCARECLKEIGCNVFYFDDQQSSCRIYVNLL